MKDGENKGRADSQDLCENSTFHVSHNLIKVLLSPVFAWHSVPEDKMFCVIWTQVLNNHHKSLTLIVIEYHKVLWRVLRLLFPLHSTIYF